MSFRELTRAFAVAAVFVVVGASAAHAVPTGHNSLTTFQNAASGASIPLTIDPLDFLTDSSGLLSTITRSAYTITDNDAPASMSENNNSAFCDGGAQPTTGCVTVTTGVNGFTFGFNSPINAFGFLLTKAQASVIPTMTLNGVLITGSYTPSSTLEFGFFGLIDTAATFSSVTLSGFTAGNLIGLDTVNFGTANVQQPPPGGGGSVPEPSASLLLLGGLPALWAAVRHARSRR